MTTYLVTTEIRTSRWIKFLRWLRIKPKRNEFKISLWCDRYKDGQIIFCGDDPGVLLILRKIG